MSESFLAEDEAWRPSTNRWLIAGTVTMAVFMELLDTAIINVSLPQIAGSLSIGVNEATWVITAYLVANGIVIPVSGWLSTVFGRKRYFMLSLGLFTLSSVLCGLSSSLPQLVFFRLLQGLSGGGLQTTMQTILLDTFGFKDRPKALTLVMATAVCAPAIGPPLGGFITDHFSWRWLFLINLPVGIISCLAVAALLEDPPWEKRITAKGAAPIDYVGLILLAIGFGVLQYVLDRGEEFGWFESPSICVLTALSLSSIAAVVVWFQEKERPLLGLTPLSNRNFIFGCIIAFGTIAPFFSTNVQLPQLVEADLGYTAQLSGLLLSPGPIATLITLFFLSNPAFKMSHHTRLVIGLVIMGACLFQIGRISPDVDYPTLVTIRFFQGAADAFVFLPLNILTYGTLSRDQLRDATCLFAMLRNVVGSASVSVTTAWVVERSQTHMADLSQHLTPFDPAFAQATDRNSAALTAIGMTPAGAAGGAQGQFYHTLIQQSSFLAYLDIFQFMGLVSIAVIPAAILFKSPSSGSHHAVAAH